MLLVNSILVEVELLTCVYNIEAELWLRWVLHYKNSLIKYI